MDNKLEISPVTDRLISLVMKLSEEQQETLIEELELKLYKERRGKILHDSCGFCLSRPRL